MQVDLQAMASSLTEDTYIGEHEILRQGTEVERIIFVKSGFCKVLRELHPKYTKLFCRYANYADPMPNPYAEGEEGLKVGEKGVWPRPPQPKPKKKASEAPEAETKEVAKPLKLESHQMLKKIVRMIQGDAEEHKEMIGQKHSEKRMRTMSERSSCRTYHHFASFSLRSSSDQHLFLIFFLLGVVVDLEDFKTH